MFRHHLTRIGLSKRHTLRLLAGFSPLAAAAIACSSGTSSTTTAPSEQAATESQALLSTPCTYDASGNLSIKVMNGEVAYVAFQAGCTPGAVDAGGDSCVIVNATDSQNNACKVSSVGKTITVAGQGAVHTDAGTTTPSEKVIIDYTNGLFAMASGGHTMLNVTLDTTAATAPPAGHDAGGAAAVLSTIEVLPPAGGGNMAIGANGLDANTLAARSGGQAVDAKFTWSATSAPGSLLFTGGAGNDVFTGDPAGWTTAPTGWDTAAHISTAVGAVYAGPLTVNGGAGNDTLAGGSGTNVLIGGVGDDTFLQGANTHAETMQGGDGLDTVDYSIRSASVSITLDGTANDGVTGENDNVNADVEVLKGGSGNDTLNASALTVTDAVLIGGAGNDVLIGGAGADDLCGGAGNDRLVWSGASGVTEPGVSGDFVSGGAGVDYVDYSAASGPIQVCLDPSDTTCFPVAPDGGAPDGGDAGAPPSPQNGVAGEVDIINTVTPSAVCPRAALTIGLAAGGFTLYTVPSGERGASGMANDVENVTGSTTHTNVLHCGSAACTAIGGTANDTIVGSPNADTIFGGGASTGDTVSGNGGNDLVDLTHTSGGALTDTVDCASANVTILTSTVDNAPVTTNCGGDAIIQ